MGVAVMVAEFTLRLADQFKLLPKDLPKGSAIECDTYDDVSARSAFLLLGRGGSAKSRNCFS